MKPCKIVYREEHIATFFWKDRLPCLFIPSENCRKTEEIQIALQAEPWIIAWYEAKLLFSSWKERLLVGDIEELQEREEYSPGYIWIAPFKLAKPLSIPSRLSSLDLNEIDWSRWDTEGRIGVRE